MPTVPPPEAVILTFHSLAQILVLIGCFDWTNHLGPNLPIEVEMHLLEHMEMSVMRPAAAC